MSENTLRTQVAVVATRALAKGGAELQEAFFELRATVPQYAKIAEAIALKAAGFLKSGAAGEIPLDMAQEAANRELGALEELALQGLDVGAQNALRRTRRAIAFTIDVGISLAKVALAAALPL